MSDLQCHLTLWAEFPYLAEETHALDTCRVLEGDSCLIGYAPLLPEDVYTRCARALGNFEP